MTRKNIFFAVFCGFMLLPSIGLKASLETKIDCRLAGYNPEQPSLSRLRLNEAEKKEITRLSQAGKKIEAIRILRKCKDLDLQQQKRLVDSLQN